MTSPGTILELDIERPAIGGRMIARHGGAVVLVAGAIPGERVRARVERVQRHTMFARVVDVVEPSPDRVDVEPGLACGGHVLAHVADARQHQLKAEMIADAFRRQARLEVGAVAVAAGAADGYRTRARAHVRDGRWGFFAEGSHTPCGIAGSRQLDRESATRLDAVCAAVAEAAPEAQADVEWAETVDARVRVAHVDLTAGRWRRRPAAVDGLSGLSIGGAASVAATQIVGSPFIADTVSGASGVTATVRHHVRAFFQGNRYLLQPLVDVVVAEVSGDTVADLYAGVGLFALAMARPGRRVDAVEGDAVAAADLAANALAGVAVQPHHGSVEAFVARAGLSTCDTVVVDPPRTGLSAAVTEAIAAARVPRVVYVSCDPVTLARDARRLIDAGYRLAGLRAFDLFPRTAHVEVVATFSR